MRQLITLIIVFIMILYVYGYGNSNWTLKKSYRCIKWRFSIKNRIFGELTKKSNHDAVIDMMSQNRKKIKILYLHKSYEEFLIVIHNYLKHYEKSKRIFK